MDQLTIVPDFGIELGVVDELRIELAGDVTIGEARKAAAKLH